MTTAALLEVVETSGGRQLFAYGAWTALHARQIDAAIDAMDGVATSLPATLDMSGVDAFDTYGAWMVERLSSRWLDEQRPFQVVGLRSNFEGLLGAVHRVRSDSPVAVASDKSVGSTLAGVVGAIEQALSDAGRDLAGLINMLGAVVQSLGQVASQPRTFRLTSAVHHLDRVGWQAVPIILLITFLIGCIIAQQGFFHFRKFGADEYVVDMVGILVLREIGVLIVAIMVAGRSGSAYTAELGAMKMREEIDALGTMGLDPVAVLILPRIVALLVALPVLAFLGSLAALYGGGLVAWLYGGMSPEIYIARLKEAISLTHFKVGMIKAPFMALVIGLVACTEGFKVKGSAESLGLKTTASVVQSIFLVIILDGLFAVLFAAIGM